jgi:hypothetical protein
MAPLAPDHLNGGEAMREKRDELNLDALDKASGGSGNVSGDLIGTKAPTTTDQASGFAGSISNILKKFSDTASSIISNLK